MPQIRPMLAAKFEESRVQAILNEVGFMYMQPKIDGMRVLVDEECIPRSRSGKEHKNKYLRAFCRDHPSLRGVDGEIVSGLEYTADTFRESMSGIRAEEGSPEFTFFAFDYYLGDIAPQGYSTRRREVYNRLSNLVPHPDVGSTIEGHPGAYTAKLVMCPQKEVRTLEEIAAYEEELLLAGWEGGILRHPDTPYKYNRSTPKDGALLKLKRFEDAEAVVVGYEPWYHNANEATQSPLGFTARSSHQENCVPLERLGALHVYLRTDPSVKFKIGVMRGVDHSTRDRLWQDREALIGRICTFAHQGYGGGYDAPRTPVFLNWRSEHDL
jgi:DNA ligase-1